MLWTRIQRCAGVGKFLQWKECGIFGWAIQEVVRGSIPFGRPRVGWWWGAGSRWGSRWCWTFKWMSQFADADPDWDHLCGPGSGGVGCLSTAWDADAGRCAFWKGPWRWRDEGNVCKSWRWSWRSKTRWFDANDFAGSTCSTWRPVQCLVAVLSQHEVQLRRCRHTILTSSSEREKGQQKTQLASATWHQRCYGLLWQVAAVCMFMHVSSCFMLYVFWCFWIDFVVLVPGKPIL